MKNSRSVSPYVFAGVGVGALLWFAFKPNKESIQDFVQSIKQKVTSARATQGLPIEKAGHPDPHDIDDNNMVSEGAMYGVHYYNKTEQEA
ncbi:MAG: hypothetical protein Q8906_03305 [Bacillota bacterium]|nr:hypothetical protein [Bacillota bacterium]MDP4169612.1 hypothetical protein [Bacillota bacterium]